MTLLASAAFVPGSERPADASVSIALSLSDLARASSAVVRVTPVDRTSTWENGRIVTMTRVRIDRVVAGTLPEGAPALVALRTLGGIVGGIGQRVEGEASLTPGESSLVFVASRDGGLGVVGRAQGQLLIRRNREGREIVRAGAVGALVPRRDAVAKAAEISLVGLDGSDLDVVTRETIRTWEATHAR